MDQNVRTTDNVAFGQIDGDSATMGQINFKTDWATDPITFSEGAVWYDPYHKNLNYYADIDHPIEIGMQMVERVYNDTGSTILKGKPLYYSGNRVDTAGQESPTVALANATSATKYNVQGLASEDIANGAYGLAVVAGVIEEFDTSGLNAGANFFVGLEDGAVQNAPPSYPNYPMCLGWVIKSDASNGKVIINQQNHSVNTFRVQGDTHIGDDLIVDGNLTVNGTQTITSTEIVSIGGNFQFLNAGDTIGEAGTGFVGTGLDDAFFAGHYTGDSSSKSFFVKIDATGTPDTFEWGFDSDVGTEATGIAITSNEQLLDSDYGIYINFGTTTGHTIGDKWTGSATALETDTGFFSNKNGGNAGNGYTHIGVYYDVSQNEWTFVGAYDPEPEAPINRSDGSFAYGDVRAKDIYATNVTGTFIGSASQLGGLTSSQFLRSDTADTKTSGDLSFSDNVKAIFGAGSDLQIYHTGTYSLIADTSGTGPLRVVTNTFQLNNAADTQNMIAAAEGGAVTLYNAGNAKLATTSTGIDVTGTVTVDGLTVESGGNALSSTGNNVQFNRASGSSFIDQIGASGSLLFRTTASQTSRLKIDTNGDISFYEDTGTTAKFFWDASTERLGIGNAAPTTALDVTGTVTADGLTVSGSSSTLATLDRVGSNGVYLNLTDNSGSNVFLGNSGGQFQVQTAGSSYANKMTVESNGDISFYEDTGTTAKFFWDASTERLGIGNAAPTTALDVTGNIAVSGTVDGVDIAARDDILTSTTTTANAALPKAGGTMTGNLAINSGSPELYFGTTGNHYNWRIAAQEAVDAAFEISVGSQDTDYSNDTYTPKFVVKSSGNVGIGTSSPSYKVDISHNANALDGLTVRSSDSGSSAGAQMILNGYGNSWGIACGSAAKNSNSLTFSLDALGANTERLRIDSSGNLLVGRTISTLGGGNGSLLQIGSASASGSGAGLTIHSGTAGVGDIQFADGTTGADSYRGLIRYEHSTNNMNFWVNAWNHAQFFV